MFKVRRLPQDVLNSAKSYRTGWTLVVACLSFGLLAGGYFEFTAHEFLVSIFLQAAGVFLALALAYFYFEHRSQERQRKIDVAVKSAVGRLRSLSTHAVTTAVEQWKEHPSRHSEYGTQHRTPSFEEARKFVLERSRILGDYTSGIDSFGSLHWVFRRFQELSMQCGQTVRFLGSGLIEYHALLETMNNVETRVESEKRVWDEFRLRTEGPNSQLPSEASYNLLVLSELVIRLVDVLDSESLEGDVEYESNGQLAPEILRRSHDWGEWR